MSKIVVAGSINMDLVVQTERAPRGGETLAGKQFSTIPGGKGANQAVAAARLGGQVEMVGCVGDDAFGEVLLQGLQTNAVGTNNVRRVDNMSSGTATIVVEDSGENRIIIVAGANGEVDKNTIDQAKEAFEGAQAVLLQFEIPLETVSHVMDYAATNNIKVILNPAPAYQVDDDFLSKVDTLVVNETEAQLFSGHPVSDLDSAREAISVLRQKGIAVVIITLGEKGALAVSDEGEVFVPARKVKAVDTTAAGDTFVGALAVSMVAGKPLEEAVRFAVASGTLAVTRLGAQTSIPTVQEVSSFLQEGD